MDIRQDAGTQHNKPDKKLDIRLHDGHSGWRERWTLDRTSDRLLDAGEDTGRHTGRWIGVSWIGMLDIGQEMNEILDARQDAASDR